MRFQFPIVNFLFICSNIPAACVFYHDFFEKWLLLTQKLQSHGFQVIHLGGHRHVLVDHRYAQFITISSFFPRKWLITRFWTRVIPWLLLTIVQNLSFVNTWVHRLFLWGSCCSIFSLLCSMDHLLNLICIVLWTIACISVFIILTNVLSGFLHITLSQYSFGLVNRFLSLSTLMT